MLMPEPKENGGEKVIEEEDWEENKDEDEEW